MGGGASVQQAAAPRKAKKVSPERAAASAAVLELLEDAARPDGEAARAIRARKIDETFKMNLMYHEEEGWGLLHVACSDRCAPARRVRSRVASAAAAL